MSTIHSDNDTIENDPLNNTSAQALNCKTNVDNNNVKYRFKLKHSQNKAKNKREKISMHNLENNSLKHEFAIQKVKRESRYKKESMLRNNVNNENMKDEHETKIIN